MHIEVKTYIEDKILKFESSAKTHFLVSIWVFTFICITLSEPVELGHAMGPLGPYCRGPVSADIGVNLRTTAR